MVIKMMSGKKHISIEDVISRSRLNIQATYRMKLRRSVRSKTS
jgi:hypothetical protein